MARRALHSTLLLMALALAGSWAQGAPAAKEPAAAKELADADWQAARLAAASAAVGRFVPPFGQCGGLQGLCNATTIGQPCGDRPWGLECPPEYNCTRKSKEFWHCEPLLGNATANNGTSMFKTAPPGASAGGDDALGGGRVVPTVGAGSGQVSGLATNGTDATPTVKACARGEFAVGNRCFSSSGSPSAGAAAHSSAAALPSGWLSLTLAGALAAAAALAA